MTNRRQFVTVASTFLGAGLAGCSNRNMDTSSEDSTDDPMNQTEENTDEEDEEINNIIEFTYQDVLDSEYTHYLWESQSVTSFSHEDEPTLWELFDPPSLSRRDMVNYGDYQDILIEMMNTMIDRIADIHNTETATSAFVYSAIPVINRHLIEEDIPVRLTGGLSAGHGYAYAFSSIHEITLVDSNWPAVGPVKDRPLRNQRPDSSDANDIVGYKFADRGYDDIEQDWNKLSYLTFPTRVMRVKRPPELEFWIVISPDVIESYYDEGVFAQNNEKLFNKMRPLRGALTYEFILESYDSGVSELVSNRNISMDKNYEFPSDWDKEYEEVIMIESELTELPKLTEDDLTKDEFEQYFKEIMDNHVTKYDTDKKLYETLDLYGY